MTHKLYTAQDNQSLSLLMEQLAKTDLSTLDAEDLSVPSLKAMIAPLKHIPFTTKGAKHTRWTLDGSALAPHRSTFMKGKDFGAVYLAQLNSILYHGSEDPPMEALTEVVFLYERVERHGTLCLASGMWVRRLPQIATILNTFFVENRQVIQSISTMVGNRLAPDATGSV